MIELVAAAPDGWAIVRDQDAHWLVRPPYRQRDRDRLGASQVDRALVDEDFEARAQAFDGWGELCRQLQHETVRRATPAEIEHAKQAAERLLARADADQARRHLERIRGALTEHRPGEVESALIALLQADSVQRNPQLVSEIGDLLALATRSRQRIRAVERPQRAWPVLNDADVERQAAAIRERGSTLLPAA